MSRGGVTGRAGGRRRGLLAIRRRWISLPCGASVLVLLVASGAFASTLSDVVPRSGSVAGQSYRSWLTRIWKLYFTSPAPGPGACQTVRVDGRTVTLVENFRGGQSTCRVPAGSAIYINEYTTHCSSIPGDHNGFPASKLVLCSRGRNGSTTKVLLSAWLDGRNVPDFGSSFWRGTHVFSVTLAPSRFHGVSQRHVSAAAWGWTLLLRRLPKGRHTVKCRVLYPNRRVKTQSLITLHVG